MKVGLIQQSNSNDILANKAKLMQAMKEYGLKLV